MTREDKIWLSEKFEELMVSIGAKRREDGPLDAIRRLRVGRMGYNWLLETAIGYMGLTLYTRGTDQTKQPWVACRFEDRKTAGEFLGEEVAHVGKWYHVAQDDQSPELFLGLFCDNLDAVLPPAMEKVVGDFMKANKLNGGVRRVA